MKARKVKSEVIEKILKRTGIKIRLRVTFQMYWLMEHIIPDRHATDEEINKAVKWSDKMTDVVLKEFKQWEKDGRPK